MAAILYGILTFVLQKVLLQFVVYTVLLFVVSEIVQYMATYLTGGDYGIGAAFSGISSIGPMTVNGTTFDVVGGFWYLFNLFRLGTGIPLILAAYATRFLIRRLPIIG